jgi:hypothetical protein
MSPAEFKAFFDERVNHFWQGHAQGFTDGQRLQSTSFDGRSVAWLDGYHNGYREARREVLEGESA